jgi:hypothetical protein
MKKLVVEIPTYRVTSAKIKDLMPGGVKKGFMSIAMALTAMTMTLTLAVMTNFDFLYCNGFAYPASGHGNDEDVNGGSFEDGDTEIC